MRLVVCQRFTLLVSCAPIGFDQFAGPCQPSSQLLSRATFQHLNMIGWLLRDLNSSQEMWAACSLAPELALAGIKPAASVKCEGRFTFLLKFQKSRTERGGSSCMLDSAYELKNLLLRLDRLSTITRCNPQLCTAHSAIDEAGRERTLKANPLDSSFARAKMRSFQEP